MTTVFLDGLRAHFANCAASANSEMNWYQVAKDFAGPTATVVASITAGIITWVFASRQTKIARQQAEIARQQAQTALDQLRYNVFERRYAIYIKVQDLLRMMLNRHHDELFDPSEFEPYRVAIREAHFFFPATVSDWLQTLWDIDLPKFLELRLMPGSPEFRDMMSSLLRRFQEMPERFGPEMQFSQLTRRGVG